MNLCHIFKPITIFPLQLGLYEKCQTSFEPGFILFFMFRYLFNLLSLYVTYFITFVILTF